MRSVSHSHGASSQAASRPQLAPQRVQHLRPGSPLPRVLRCRQHAPPHPSRRTPLIVPISAGRSPEARGALTFRCDAQLGHQAANCTNGTINWKQIYGDEAFKLKAPLYESDFERLKKSKQVDFEDLERRAREYAKV